MVSYILITGCGILLFMNPLNFKFLQVPAVAAILKVLLVNLLAALNFANVFFLNKKGLENKERYKRKNATKIKNGKKRVLHLWVWKIKNVTNVKTQPK